MLAVARYRFRATLRRRWGGYVAIVLLVGLLGGLAMAAVAGARRTQSSYPAFLRSTNPSDLTVPTALWGLNGSKTGYDPTLVREIARLPHVAHVESQGSLNMSPVQPNGANFQPSGPSIELGIDASIDGEFVDQDRITITKGRMLDPAQAGEIVVSARVARALRAHVGSVVPFAFYTNAQEATPGPSGDEYRPHPYAARNLTVVGIGLFNNAIVQDDVDAAGSDYVLFSPALTRPLISCCVQSTITALRLDHGSADVTTVEAELSRLNPLLSSREYVTGVDAAKAERTIKPESIALAVFGLIAALAALAITSQLIGRVLSLDAGELDVLRALGARPATTTVDGLPGVIGAAAVGTLLAVGVAAALSPLAPIGPVRPVYPFRGVAFDWTVLGFGALVLFLVASVVAVVFAFRQAPHRVARRTAMVTVRRSRAASVAAAAALPVPLTSGVRFALEPGRGRNAVPVRSAILGAALAILVVVGTVTFGSSLHTLTARPALYGWNWDYELSGGNGGGAIPQQLSDTALRADHDVAGWGDVYFGGARIGNLSVPGLAVSPNAPVSPPVLSGHGLDATDQIVLGPATLAALHEHLGATVSVNLGTKPARLKIVGTATMPAIGQSGSLHMEMGSGALVSYSLIPAPLRDPSGNTPTGPNAIFVRFRAGVDHAAALRTLERMASDTLSKPTNWGVGVVAVQHPAEIVNYRSMSGTPLVLGGTLALGAVAALALTLVASVRRRRRDLALLKTFGFTRRQLAATVAWQSTIAVAIGTVIGVPLGIIVGRTLWDLFAREIYAVPRPTVPVATVALIAIGALVLANLVAAIPGRQAARTQTAVLLREE